MLKLANTRIFFTLKGNKTLQNYPHSDGRIYSDESFALWDPYKLKTNQTKILCVKANNEKISAYHIVSFTISIHTWKPVS